MYPPTLCWGVSPYFFTSLTPLYSESSKFPLTRNLPDHNSSFLHPCTLPFLEMHSQHCRNSCLPSYHNDDVIRDGSILIFPLSSLSYGFLWENQPQNLKGWEPQRLFLLLVRRRAGCGFPPCLWLGVEEAREVPGQRNGPHGEPTYPLLEQEKWESRRNILMVPKASPGDWHTALSSHIGRIKSHAKPDTGKVRKHSPPKATHSKLHDNKQRWRRFLQEWGEKINNNATDQ